MMLVSVLSAILFVCGAVKAQSSGPVVDTVYGSVQGFQGLDRLNRTYDGFLGIPYAQPPVEDLRWQPSVPPEPWADTLEVIEYSPHSIQPISGAYELAGMAGNDSEDCLYLNVFVPVSVENALSEPLPVMVWYYGGGFVIGTTEMYPGEELATAGDVIVVTVNYRVSIMGFFSTGDSAAPGNYGLWDSKRSLEWVNANIAQFGGDPSRITIFGQSAGSFLVSHAMISPQTNTLFQRGIGMSGGAGYYENPKMTAQYLGDLFNCSTTVSEDIVACLRTLDAKDIDSLFYLTILDEEEVYDVDVVIDGDFVTQDPRESWKAGVAAHLQLMNGYTYHDSAGFVVSNILALPNNRSDDGNPSNVELEEYVRDEFRAYDNVDEIIETLYTRYPAMNDTDPATASEAVTRVETDFDFASRTFYQVEKQAEAGGTAYFYEFRYRQSFLDAYPAWVNGSHIDDIYSVLGQVFFQEFREFYLQQEYSEEDNQMIDLLQKYYANFAYTGNPNTGPFAVTLDWPEYDLASRQYLIQTLNPYIAAHSQADVDEYQWFLYELWGMLRPEWGVPRATRDVFLPRDVSWEFLQEL